MNIWLLLLYEYKRQTINDQSNNVFKKSIIIIIIIASRNAIHDWLQ